MAGIYSSFRWPQGQLLRWRPPQFQVFADGRYLPNLQVVDLSSALGADCSQVTLRWAPSAVRCGRENERFDEVGPFLKRDTRIEIIETSSRPGADYVVTGRRVFFGRFAEEETELSGNDEGRQWAVPDSARSALRVEIGGPRYEAVEGGTIELPVERVLFNPGRIGNATSGTIAVGSKEYVLFSSDEATSVKWNPARAVDYLLNEWLDDSVAGPLLSHLEAVLGTAELRELDVSGRTLGDAVQRVCDTVGACYRAVVRGGEGPGPAYVLEFMPVGKGRRIFMRHQPPGEMVDPEKTSVQVLDVRRGSGEASRTWVGRSAPKRFEGTFELVPGWDPAGEGQTIDMYDPGINPDFWQVRDVYRKWVLNETGAYSGAPYNQPAAYDFSALFGTSLYVRRARQFLPALSTYSTGASIYFFVEWSPDSGSNWYRMMESFSVYRDECGLYILDDALNWGLYDAVNNDTGKVRITCCVEADERASGTFTDQRVPPAWRTPVKQIDLGGDYQYRQVTDQSILYQTTDPDYGSPEEMDQTEAIEEELQRRAEATTLHSVEADIELPHATTAFAAGDVVEAVSGREVPLDLGSDRFRHFARVASVRCQWEEKQTTTIKLEGR